MQYNIFKIRNSEELLKEMINSNYKKSKTKRIEKYELTLYYNKSEASKLSWKKILEEFEVDIVVNRNCLKGILIVSNTEEMYAITYGMSSALVQKYCDENFAINIAKRVEISKIKRKASKILNGKTRSLIRTMTNSDVLVFDKGESIVNLQLIPKDEENLGKNLTVGKSLKIDVKKSIECLPEIIETLSKIENDPIKRPIPFLTKLCDENKKEKIWEKLNKEFNENIKNLNFSLDSMNILGSSIYFDDDFELELSYHRIKEEISLVNTETIRIFIEKNNISDEKPLENIKVKYINDGGDKFFKPLKSLITFDFTFEDINYVLFDGDIFNYNSDFKAEIDNGLKRINFQKYDPTDDKSLEWYNEYLKEKGLADVKEKNIVLGERKTTYREKAINDCLSNKYQYENLDTHSVGINKDLKYKIEIADLGKEDEIIYAVKVGGPKDFCYAIDQSNLILDMLLTKDSKKNPKIKKYENVEKIGLWLYTTGSKKIHNNNGEIEITKFNSIMFLTKLVDWANNVISAEKKPEIRLNYYNK